jgi:hypothetical protein
MRVQHTRMQQHALCTMERDEWYTMAELQTKGLAKSCVYSLVARGDVQCLDVFKDVPGGLPGTLLYRLVT